MIDKFLLLWAVPSLVVFFLLIQASRYATTMPKEPSDYDFATWLIFLTLSIIHILGFAALFAYVVWPWLVKTRREV